MTHRKLTTSPTTVSSGNDHAGRKTQLSHWSSRLHAPLQMTPQDSTFSTLAHDTCQTLSPGLKHTFAQLQFRSFSSKAHPSELCLSNSSRRTQNQEHYLHYHSLLPSKWAHRRQVDHSKLKNHIRTNLVTRIPMTELTLHAEETKCPLSVLERGLVHLRIHIARTTSFRTVINQTSESTQHTLST